MSRVLEIEVGFYSSGVLLLLDVMLNDFDV